MFYDNFINLCNSIHKKPAEVMRDMGLAKSTATRWKGGGMPTDTTKQMVADYFGVPLSELEKENPLVHGDERLTEILEMYEKRSDVRILFGTLPGASPESVMKAAMMIEEDRKKKDVDT